MLNKYKYKNWRNPTPSNFVEYLLSPASSNLRIINFIFQKIFGINRKMKFMVHYTSQVSGKIEIGANVAQYMAGSGSCYMQGINGISIGDNTMIAPGVKIISANHDLNNRFGHIEAKPVKIGKNCWLGTNVVILPETEIGDNVIIGAGSVVTKSFESNLVIVGNPAKIIRTL